MATAVYVRISRDAELTRLGVRRQRADCEQLCAAQRWSPVTVYEDNDVSAFSGKRRPAYERMLADVKAGVVDRVVAWHPDRLHRSLTELQSFIEVVEAAGCDVVTVREGHYDLSTVGGRMTARILGAVAEAESEHKSARIKRKIEELAEAGAPSLGGSRPFGYRRVLGDDGRYSLEVDDAEAAIVREMLDRFVAGESLRSLCRDLDARGVPTATGKTWARPGTLKGILTNPFIAGRRVHHGQVAAAGTWPALVELDEVMNARAVAAFLQASPKRTSPAHVLNGIVVCSGCAGPLYAGQVRNGQQRLRCRGRSGACVTVSRDPVVDLVTDAVLALFDTVDLEAHLPRRPGRAVAGRAVAEARDAEAQLAELATAYADRVISLGEWQVARDRIQQRLEAARRSAGEEITTAAAVLPFRGKPGALRKAWPDMSIPQRRAVFAAVIERITVRPGWRGAGARNLVERLDIAWRA